MSTKDSPTGRRIVSTEAAPAAIGPYSQGVVHRGVVYTAGQIALDPGTGEMVGGGIVAAEAEQVMRNLSAVLGAAGSDFSRAIRCEIYLADLADYAVVNEVYGRYFEGCEAPARVAIEAARLPRDARVEIACTAATH
jgi:2-iminobutanoate/2-iminopropanoate deaminase